MRAGLLLLLERCGGAARACAQRRALLPAACGDWMLLESAKAGFSGQVTCC